MSAAEILAAYRASQFKDVKETLARVRSDANDLTQEIGILKRYLAVYPNANFRRTRYGYTPSLRVWLKGI
jgi:hypothetical protein